MLRPADILSSAGIPAEVTDERVGLVARIESSRAEDVLAVLRDAGYDFFVDLFGTDDGEAIELTWHLRSLPALADVFVRATVPYDGEAPSVWRVFPAALYPERETAELLGVSFPGHPNPKRLLTTEGTDPYLRRSVLIRGAEEVRMDV